MLGLLIFASKNVTYKAVSSVGHGWNYEIMFKEGYGESAINI